MEIQKLSLNKKSYIPEIHPKSPLIYFINMSFILFYVPFKIQYSPLHSRYIVIHSATQRFICALFHLIVIHYYIFSLIDHFQNFAYISGSPVSTLFRTATRFAITVACVLLVKLVWFLDRQKLETALNSTASMSMTQFYFKLSKFVLLIAFIINTFSNFNATLILFRTSDIIRVNVTDNLTFYLRLINLFSRSTVSYWIWIAVQTHVLISYFIIQAFFFSLSCSMIGMTLDLKHALLISSRNTDLRKVFNFF